MVIHPNTQTPAAAPYLPAQPAVEHLTANPISPDEIDPDVHVEDEAILRAEVSLLYGRLDLLSPAQRVVVRLQFGLAGEEWTIQETAWAIGASVRTTHRLERSALAALRRMYQIGERHA
jgi:DNA-directed RNA polymerase specialized sigma24 family protein